MKRTGMNYVIISSMYELCRFLHRTDVEIIEIVPEKSIANEDVVKVTYFHLEEWAGLTLALSFYIWLRY